MASGTEKIFPALDKDAISCFSIRKDWRFAVRAKSFALHWRSRGFFRGRVRSCEKGLCLACRGLPGNSVEMCLDKSKRIWILERDRF